MSFYEIILKDLLLFCIDSLTSKDFHTDVFEIAL